MPLGEADLLFDQVDVVEQPFGRRRQMALGLHRGLEHRPGAIQHAPVVEQALQQTIGRGLQADPCARANTAP